ncbi:MAG: hypothetical protein MUE61_02285 [Vicinamibacterales bacterium]|jgi:hypothetical protein|nr:hypothetical protein [Vicinamibacterales bacterium]
MSPNRLTLLVFPFAALVFVGCEASKSANPTSPSVAGPIAGVNITTPAPVSPGTGSSIPAKDQPVTLVVQNAATNGQRPITYRFEVAVDAEFNTKVATREGVEPGGDGKTSYRLPDALAPDRTYYWRAKALDGANESAFSEAVSFAVVNIGEIQTPVPLSPVGASTTSNNTPEFRVRNAVRTGPVGAVYYTFEVSENESFSAMIAIVTVPERATETKFTINQALRSGIKFYWRVRAFDSNVASAWSLTQSFVTPKVTAPPPSPSPAPPPPGPSGPPAGGWPRTGDEVVAWATSRYQDRLVAGVSLSQRQANMAYVRDRMIEAGICGGMELAWNLKRGGPEKSIDYLAYRKAGRWIGVDIGSAYDDTSIRLDLQWMENPGDSLVTPATYSPAPSCR